jgi:hypothetical protein
MYGWPAVGGGGCKVRERGVKRCMTAAMVHGSSRDGWSGGQQLQLLKSLSSKHQGLLVQLHKCRCSKTNHESNALGSRAPVLALNITVLSPKGNCRARYDAINYTPYKDTCRPFIYILPAKLTM